MLSALVRAVRQPVVVVLSVAGLVDVVIGDPAAHGIALVAVATLLFRDGLIHRGQPARGDVVDRWRFEVTPAMLPAGLVYAVVVGTFDRFSWPLTVGVAVPGAWAVSLAWRGTPTSDPERASHPDLAASLPWVAVFLALAAWEVQALLLQPSITTSSWEHPTLSTLMDPVLATHVGRSITMTLWLALGGYLLER